MPPQKPIVGYDPDSGKAITGYDPNTGKYVYAETADNKQEPKPQKGLFGTIGTLGEIAYGLVNRGRTPVQDLDTIQRNLPSIGGAAGGIIGGIGGTVGGFGVGGVPGAVGGAALGGATGEAVNQVMDAGRAYFNLPTANEAPPPLTVTEAAKRMGTQGAVQGATELTGQGVGRAIAYGARRAAPVLMRSAMKPGAEVAQDVTSQGVPKVVQTMLDEGATVTRKGVKKLYDLLGEAGKTIEAKTATAPGSVFPEQTVDHALDITKGFADQVNNAQDLKAIADSANQFLEERMAKSGSLLPAKPMTVTEAQTMKTGTYRALGNKSFGELKGASIEGQKALASGLKTQIEQLVPGIAKDNARWAALSDALDTTAHRVGITGNRDLGGIFWVAHNPAAFLAAQFDRSPAVKSLVAKGLWEQAGKIAKVPPQLLRFAVMALASEPEPMEPMASHERNR